jgi:hypothetical protein
VSLILEPWFSRQFSEHFVLSLTVESNSRARTLESVKPGFESGPAACYVFHLSGGYGLCMKYPPKGLVPCWWIQSLRGH